MKKFALNDVQFLDSEAELFFKLKHDLVRAVVVIPSAGPFPSHSFSLSSELTRDLMIAGHFESEDITSSECTETDLILIAALHYRQNKQLKNHRYRSSPWASFSGAPRFNSRLLSKNICPGLGPSKNIGLEEETDA